MSDETAKGLLALKPGGMGGASYETSEYPAIPEYMNIAYYKGSEQKPNAKFLDAQAFLTQEHIPFTIAPEDAKAPHRGVISITGKENTGKLYEVLQEFSGKSRVAEMEKWQGSSSSVADSVLWEAFGPWLQKALEIDPPKGMSPIMLRQSKSFGVAIRDKATELATQLGATPEKAAEFGVKMGRIAQEIGRIMAMGSR
ncbi:MAG: hypothetical protein K2Q12_07630 [Rickettsiales bacterium]|nr:hypothetical protein [Rickettsiales bacterium]